MILGRTASNAIKIKTDGTTRAVNCACCNTCGCATAISGDLAETLNNATTGTCNGRSPFFWNFYPTPIAPATTPPAGWYAAWFFREVYTLRWYADTKCLDLGGDNAFNIIAGGNCKDCGNVPTNYGSPSSCVDQEYTINGVSFPCHSDIFDDRFPPVPSPVFVLS